jgi:hypothetical protein
MFKGFRDSGWRRALTMLADAGRRGQTHAFLLANGVSRDLMRDLVGNGYALVVTTGRLGFTNNTMVSRVRITDAGRRALAEAKPFAVQNFAGMR